MRSKGMAVSAVSMALALFFLMVPAHACAGEPETIHIADGGHYAVGPFMSWGRAEIWVNMTVLDGGPVDVYIMSAVQYENSYPSGSGQPLAVSYKNASAENVTSASIHYAWESADSEAHMDSIYVVVDNRHCALTRGDADPEGPVTVRLEVDSTGSGYGFYDYDYDIGDFPFMLCVAAPILTMVIIVALFLLATRRSGRARQPPPFPPPCPMPPPEPPRQPEAPSEPPAA